MMKNFNLFVIYFFYTIVCSSYIFSISDEEMQLKDLKLRIRDEFDSTAYLEMNSDIARHYSTREEAAEHYLTFGHKEGRVFPSLYPNQPGFNIAMTKLSQFIRLMDERKVPKDKRTFIIFHVGLVDSKNSYEVIINNLKIFNYSVVHDNEDSRNFYWFNVIGGNENNMKPYLPDDKNLQWNVAKLEWLVSPSDILMHLRTLNVVKNSLELNFGSVFFMNNGVRGPMLYKERGEWVEKFRSLLNDEHKVGMAGPSISCEVSPHIQTHAYIMRTNLIPALLTEYTQFHSFSNWPQLIRHYEVGMSQFVMKNGWNISALIYKQRLNKDYFDGYCIPVVNSHKNGILNNPSRWCDLKPEELIIYKFGGEMLRVSGFVCDRVREYMRKEIFRLNEAELSYANLIIPETLKGGILFDLFKQYDLEMFRDYEAHAIQKIKPYENKLNPEANKVCFLVRTAQMHDEKQTSPYGESIASGSIEEIIGCECFLFLIICGYVSCVFL
jgi:hypothetical protein